MNKEKFLPIMTLLFCCVVAILFFNLIYAPLKSETASKEMQVRRFQAVEKNLDEFKKRHGNLENFFTLTESRLSDARNFLPAESMQGNFVAELYKVAEKNNVIVSSIQIGEIQAVEQNSDNNKNFFRQTVTVKFEADYISTLKFLREILNGNRLTTLENISLENGENNLSGNMELSIFNLAAPS